MAEPFVPPGALYFAVRYGHRARAEELIASGANVNLDILGSTPLMKAIRNGSTEFVSLLLDAGADINKTNPDDDETPLYVAVYNGYTEIVSKLLAAGANVDKATLDGTTPLIIAVLKGYTEIVSMLLDAGADVNAVPTDGTTALYAAAKTGDLNTVKKLIQKGAKTTIPTVRGKSVLEYAKENRFSREINEYFDPHKRRRHALLSRSLALARRANRKTRKQSRRAYGH